MWCVLIKDPPPPSPHYAGTVGGTFAAGACVSAGVRNKDDYVNAAVGGMLAGSVFGIKCECVINVSWCVCACNSMHMCMCTFAHVYAWYFFVVKPSLSLCRINLSCHSPTSASLVEIV